MLFDEPVLFFKGLTIFRDFANPNQYYFLPPEAPRIARSAEASTDYALRLVLYRPDPNAPAPQGMENGGGFLNLDVDLHVDDRLLEQVASEVQKRFGGQANLVPVPFLRGSVELILLGVGREDEGRPFVRKVAGSATPALYGAERAAFSVVLDRDGAALMRQVIEKGGLTMALAIYHLTYAAIPPAYNLKITVDYSKVYERLDLNLKAGVKVGSGKSSFVGNAGFHMLMEDLKENRAVTVVEVDPVPGENGRTPVDQARIDEIIGNLMGSKWFKPTLAAGSQLADLGSAASAPGGAGAGAQGSGGGGAGGAQPAASGTQPSSAGTQPAAGSGQRANAQWHEDSKTPAAFPADRGIEPFQPSQSGTQEALVVKGAGATAKAGSQANQLQTVQITNNRIQLDVPEGGAQHVEIKWPASPGAPGERRPATWTGPTAAAGDQRGVEPFQPSASGDNETLVLRGAGATAKAGSSPTSLQPVTLSDGNRVSIPVPGGETRHVEITWPASAGAEETFYLFFDYPRPTNATDVTGYTNRRPSPAEPNAALHGEQARFLEQSRSPTTTRRGPDGLDEWLGTLEPRTPLTLDAYASYEGDDTPDKQRTNRELSQRRLQVAQNLIGSRFPTQANPPHGHADSKPPSSIPTLSDDTAPQNSRGGRPQHRVVLIKGRKRGTAETVVRGQLNRAAPPGGQGQPESTLTGHLDRAAAGRKESKDETSVQASFEINLEMIQREERVVATYELSTRKARTQEVHPQGQLILDAANPLDYIIEADGALDFFQWVNVAASTTAQWEREGIDAIQIQIRYAPENGRFRRTGEMVLTKAQPTGSFKSGVLRERDGDLTSPVLYAYDYRVTVHYLPDVAMGDQSGAVTSVGVKGADPDGWITTTERNLVVHPRDVTPVILATIMSGVMRFDLLQRVQLSLTYGPNRQNLTLAQDHPEHRLVIRPEAGLKDARIRTAGTLFYKDGAQVPLPPQDWDPRELIVINEPRENILRVQVILADPGHEYAKVTVRLRYEHANRAVEEVRELVAHAQMEEWAVRLEDPAFRDWQYMATLIKKSGDIDTIDWTDGRSNQLILGVRAVDVIPVQVTWLIPPSGDLMAVKIDLRYADEANGVSWTHSELIRGTHPGDFAWSIAIADAKKRSYQYRVTQFTRSSGAKEGAWTDSSETMLVLPE
jgi:hypothetical protein